jgi:glycosyltransferase involved in cell wall biosynthesis
MRPYIAHVSRARSILLVAQLTPPSPLSGARRPANLVKYLTRRGHRVTVLTSLASGRGEVAGAWRVVRTRDVLASRLNWRSGHFKSIQGREQAPAKRPSALESIVVPDLALIGWLPFALPRALSLARQRQFDCVVSTSPPPAAHLIGLGLRCAGLPWIADLRDGWTFDPPRPPWPSRLQEAADRALERTTLARADRLVAVTVPIAEDLAERLGREVATITNGFDPEEAGNNTGIAVGLLTPDRHSLVHTGRAGVSGRSPRVLVEGLVELRRLWPEAAERLEVVFAGPTTAEERELLADERLAGMVRSVGAFERPRALALQRAADSLLVLTAGSSRQSVATNKLFEYLAARRPVLVLGKDSVAARIVDEVGGGIVADANDPKAIAAALRALVEENIKPASADLARFAWPVLAERFEREIETVLADVPSTTRARRP